jgi:hypothetical protein
MSVPDDLFYPCLIFTLEHFTEMEVYVVLYDLLNWPSVYDSDLYLNLVSKLWQDELVGSKKQVHEPSQQRD